jgi:hypothetical protein
MPTNPRDPSLYPQVYDLRMTREKALAFGLVRCRHCRGLPSQHFDFPPFVNAHKECPGYEEVVQA